MNITEAINRACEEPTLLKAQTWICIWESESVVKQSLANPQSQWETYFGICLKLVTGEYWKKNDRRINSRRLP